VTPTRIEELAELVVTAAGSLSRRMGAEQSGAYAPTALRVRTQERDRSVVKATPVNANTDNITTLKEQ
jgi:hypothetical protein